MRNYYHILGISPFADQQQVRAAFRQKAKSCHPDVSSGAYAVREFQRINEAYQVLKDKEKRRLYDMRLRNGFPSEKIHYRPGKVRYRAKGDKYAHYDSKESATGSFEKIEGVMDTILFSVLVFIGCFAFFYGIYRLWVRPEEEIDPLPGIIMGLFFTGLILFVWRTKNKLLDKEN